MSLGGGGWGTHTKKIFLNPSLIFEVNWKSKQSNYLKINVYLN